MIKHTVTISAIFLLLITLFALIIPSAANVETIADSPCPNKDLFHLIDLGALGGIESYPFDINNLGQVVGSYSLADTPPGTPRSFIWFDDTMTDLGDFTGEDFYGLSLNDFGHIAGYIFTDTLSYPVSVAAYYDLKQVTELKFDPGIQGQAWGINNQGQIAGRVSSVFPRGNNHAVLWDDLTPVDIGTLGGYTSEAFAINNDGIVVGFADNEMGKPEAFKYENEELFGLSTLGGDVSHAVDINDLGQIVGYSVSNNNTQHAFIWENGQMRDLGQLVKIPNVDPNTIGSFAFGINNKGDVVGQYSGQAALWRGGKVFNLNACRTDNTAISVLTEARDINDLGWIIGQGTVPNGKKHAFIMTTPTNVYLPVITN
jgi:probable HAF family extracellular repeat protein